MKVVLFNQRAGLGDIFFLQKAAKFFKNNGFEVIWPIIPEFMFIKNYIDDIKFVDCTSSFPYSNYYGSSKPLFTDNFVYVPFDESHFMFGVSSMKGKYTLLRYMGFDIDSENWKDYFTFKRYPDREEECKKILQINDEDFIFVNNMFASPPDIVYRDVNIDTSNLKIITHKLEHIKMFNPFDLCWVLENAKQIHTVETSLCYLIEKLETKGKLHMYSRKIHGRLQNPDFSYVDHIYKKDWNYIL